MFYNCPKQYPLWSESLFFFYFFIFKLYITVLVLPNIKMNPPQVYILNPPPSSLPILNPPPSSLPIPSLWVVPVHQPQASSIVHRTWTGNSFHLSSQLHCKLLECMNGIFFFLHLQCVAQHYPHKSYHLFV